ncbi:hypothetical protein AAFF_G00349180 [Aldrovandia affinis]|uniref:Uncharacterized protein n=1 Tax=Aldrovandia affinis TaxID=143900 RepID=A0AAD7SJ48_9TELE|nr:hypothetical protein AAFF_G00349180 [Aldrovandia affinis]
MGGMGNGYHEGKPQSVAGSQRSDEDKEVGLVGTGRERSGGNPRQNLQTGADAWDARTCRSDCEPGRRASRWSTAPPVGQDSLAHTHAR